VRKPEGKRLLPRPRHKWEGGVKVDGKETELEGIDWIHMAEDRGQCGGLLFMAMNHLVPENDGEYIY
jgi:hypothetical protein